jgi:hypothetical protein
VRPVGPTLAIEVTPLPVRLVLWGGATADVLVFLHSTSDRRPGPETLGERLCHPDTFFLPCIFGRGVELINLEHVMTVRARRDLPEVEDLESMPSFRAGVELDLIHGERLSGEIRYRLPPGCCRVSDLFNGIAERFVLLTTDNSVIYVNRRAVVRVRIRTEDSSCR